MAFRVTSFVQLKYLNMNGKLHDASLRIFALLWLEFGQMVHGLVIKFCFFLWSSDLSMVGYIWEVI